MDTIVVGVDGSAEARRAYEWAVAEARLRRGRLHIVHVYDTPVLLGEYHMAVGGSPQQLVAQARARANAVVDDLIAGVDTDGVEIEREVIEDVAPARALVDRSKDAAMLVVGSRGRGGFAGLMLGSVSQQCAHHSTVPLVVVPSR